MRAPMVASASRVRVILPFKNLVDELLHHVLAALLGKRVLAEAALGDNLIQQRHFSGLCLRRPAPPTALAGLLMLVSLRLAANLGLQLVQLFGL